MQFNKYFSYLCIIIVLLVNEFTFILFDEHYSIKGTLRILYLRLFDIIIFIIGILFFFHHKGISYFKIFSTWFLNYIAPVIIIVLLIDLSMFFLGYGYQSIISHEQSKRYPSPGDTFSGKPNVLDHNNFGFKGKFATSEDSFNIAIFGGSTGYNGKPPIIKTVNNNLLSKGIKNNFFNFSSVSSNHTQHVHRLLKYVDHYKYDVVVFYGGGNSTFQYTILDPRPGYPTNFFFLNELHPFLQVLIKYSSIIGQIDIYTNGAISGYKKLQLKYKDSKNWNESIINNYWKDLSLANRITKNLVTSNICSQPTFISITQPLNPVNQELIKMYKLLRESIKEFDNSWLHLDYTIYDSKVEFKDWVHISQNSRDLIANQITNELIEIHNKKC